MKTAAGELLKKARTILGLSQMDLAQRMNLPSTSNISLFEKGFRTEKPEVLREYARAMRIPEDDFLSALDQGDLWGITRLTYEAKRRAEAEEDKKKQGQKDTETPTRETAVPVQELASAEAPPEKAAPDETLASPEASPAAPAADTDSAPATVADAAPAIPVPPEETVPVTPLLSPDAIPGKTAEEPRQTVKINGRRMARARQRMNYSQKDLARQMGWSDSRVCQLEKGNPNVLPETIETLSSVLGISTEYLTDFSTTEETPGRQPEETAADRRRENEEAPKKEEPREAAQSYGEPQGPPPTAMLFGARLTRARMDIGISQTSLGKKMGWVGGSRVSQLEHASRPAKKETIEDLARILGVATDYLTTDLPASREPEEPSGTIAPPSPEPLAAEPAVASEKEPPVPGKAPTKPVASTPPRPEGSSRWTRDPDLGTIVCPLEIGVRFMVPFKEDRTEQEMIAWIRLIATLPWGTDEIIGGFIRTWLEP